MLQDTYKEYRELQYNAYNMLKESYSHQEVTEMPLKDLFELIDFYTPKLKEIAEQRANSAMEAELAGKRKPPSGQRR